MTYAARLLRVAEERYINRGLPVPTNLEARLNDLGMFLYTING